MNAPATPATLQPALATLAIGLLMPSPTNPRKRFDKAAIADLAASIGKQGIVQPLLVRPRDAKRYEIVCGERRFRAAKEAGLLEVPCLVRELSDVEVLEVQVVENLQRSDLHPLEEAEGYEALMKKHLYTVDDIAAKVGKSRAYVYARLKLTALSTEARKWFDEGKLTASTALLIARIPVPSLQLKAAREIGDPKHRSEPMSFREAADYLQREYMLRLAEAPFPTDDTTLVVGAGACSACPRRTGNQPDLFPDVKSGDVCTDPGCFKAKRDAFTDRRLKEAQARGIEIIKGDEAKKLKPYQYDQGLRNGFRSLDEIDYAIDPSKTLRQLVGKGVAPTALVVDPHDKGKLIEAISDKALKAALAEKGIEKRGSTGGARDPEQAAKDAAERAKRAREEAFRQRLFAKIFEKHDGKLTRDNLAQIVLELNNFALELVAPLLGWPLEKGGNWVDDAAVEKSLKTMSEKELSVAIAMILLTNELNPYGKGEALLAAAKRLRIDPAKVRRDLAAEEKATAKPANTPKRTKTEPTPKAAAKKRPAAKHL